MSDNTMFCFQCEQTAGCEACTGKAGVCGKPGDVAFAQDELTGAMVGLARTARAAGNITDNAKKLVVDGLFTCVTNVNFNKETVDELAVHEEAKAIADAAGIEVVEDYDMATMWNEDEDIRSLKTPHPAAASAASAAYAHHARVLGATDDAGVDTFFIAGAWPRWPTAWPLDELLPPRAQGRRGQRHLHAPARRRQHRRRTAPPSSHRGTRSPSSRAPSSACHGSRPARTSQQLLQQTDGQRRQRLHPLAKTLARPRLPGPQGAPPPQGQLRHRVVPEPAEGVRQHPRAPVLSTPPTASCRPALLATPTASTPLAGLRRAWPT